MPLPTPQKGEKEQEFISRCIKEVTDEERDKWPDEKQRAAICYSQWDKHIKEETGKDIKS